jgi:hypothetical protein
VCSFSIILKKEYSLPSKIIGELILMLKEHRNHFFQRTDRTTWLKFHFNVTAFQFDTDWSIRSWLLVLFELQRFTGNFGMVRVIISYSYSIWKWILWFESNILVPLAIACTDQCRSAIITLGATLCTSDEKGRMPPADTSTMCGLPTFLVIIFCCCRNFGMWLKLSQSLHISLHCHFYFTFHLCALISITVSF